MHRTIPDPPAPSRVNGRALPYPKPRPTSPQVVLLRPIVAATLDARLDRRELELAWGCQVMIHDLLVDHGVCVVVDRRHVVQSWHQSNPAAYAVEQARTLDVSVPVALLTRFDRGASRGVRVEGIVVDLHGERVVTRGRAEKSPSRIMSWLTHVPDHIAFALGEPTPKYAWREVLGVRDADRALGQVRLAGALARMARLGTCDAVA